MAADDKRLVAARARLLQLKQQHVAGSLDDAGFAAARRAIEHEISEGLLAGDGAVARVRPSLRLVAMLSVAVLALALFGYWRTGSPSLARLGPAGAETAALAGAGPAGAASGATAEQQIEAMIAQLAERMKERPDDAQGWTMLARSYTVLSRFAEALPAYEKASQLQPANAGLLADYADAVAATKGKVDNPQSVALVERALAAEPKHIKALALAGTLAYERGDFAGAMVRWQTIVDQLPPDNEVARQVSASIAEARERAGGKAAPSAPATAAGPPPATQIAAADPAKPGATATGSHAVSGTVTLDPALRAQADPADSVFVFARPASGGRMPLAVLRAKVADLPLTFKLDDSMAMAPGMTISSVPLVIVGARISKSGNAIAQPGDLAGETTGVAPGTSNIAIRIGSVVGPR